MRWRERKILILDVDNCLLRIEGLKAFFSDSLLKFVRKKKYDAFYIYYPYQVHGEKYVACGLLETINNIKKHKEDHKKITVEKPIKLNPDKDTNDHIKKIIAHENERFPNSRFSIDVISAEKTICESALYKLKWEEIKKAAPKITQLSLHHHDAYESEGRNIEIKEIEETISFNLKSFQENENSIFDLDIEAHGKERLSEKKIAFLARLRIQQENIQKITLDQKRALESLIKKDPVVKLGTIKPPSFLSCASIFSNRPSTPTRIKSISSNISPTLSPNSKS